MATSSGRNQYNPNLTTADAVGIACVIGLFVSTIIIILVLFVMRKKKACNNIVVDSKKDKVEELELENRVGKAIDVHE